MINLFKTLFTPCLSYLIKRNLFLTSNCYSYEGNGKTTITILNNNFDYGLMINRVYVNGFMLNNGVKVIGPMIIFPKTMLSWNIASSPDMNEESFALFLNLDPKLDVFIIGLDNEYPYNAPFLQNIKNLFRTYKISTEILPVHQACATFNFINAENRYGAAALIPPKIKNLNSILLQNELKQYTLIKNTDEGLSKDNFENPLKLEDKSKTNFLSKFKKINTNSIDKLQKSLIKKQ